MQKEFGHEFTFDDGKRQFVFEENINLIEANVLIYCNAYFLKDVIVLSFLFENKKVIKKYVYLSHLTIIKDEVDGKHFKNIVQINGQNDSLRFTLDSLEQKQQILPKIQEILKEFKATRQNVHSSLKFPIDVTVIGTEERNNSGFNKHTIYITQLKVHHLVLNLYLRYSSIKKLAEELNNIYPGIQIHYDFSVGNWLNNHMQKIIEIRKGLVQEFLQCLL